MLQLGEPKYLYGSKSLRSSNMTLEGDVAGPLLEIAGRSTSDIDGEKIASRHDITAVRRISTQDLCHVRYGCQRLVKNLRVLRRC